MSACIVMEYTHLDNRDEAIDDAYAVSIRLGYSVSLKNINERTIFIKPDMSREEIETMKKEFSSAFSIGYYAPTASVDMPIKKAYSIGFITQGYYCDTTRPVLSGGSCFTLMDGDGIDYKIVNFCYENFDHLNRNLRILTFPVNIISLRTYDNSGIAILKDDRIPENYYSSRYCEACCPMDLLPKIQKEQLENDIKNGIRNKNGSFILNNKKNINGLASIYAS